MDNSSKAGRMITILAHLFVEVDFWFSSSKHDGHLFFFFQNYMFLYTYLYGRNYISFIYEAPYICATKKLYSNFKIIFLIVSVFKQNNQWYKMLGRKNVNLIS